MRSGRSNTCRDLSTLPTILCFSLHEDMRALAEVLCARASTRELATELTFSSDDGTRALVNGARFARPVIEFVDVLPNPWEEAKPRFVYVAERLCLLVDAEKGTGGMKGREKGAGVGRLLRSRTHRLN